MTRAPLSESIQDYLKRIYALQEGGGRVTITAIARAQAVSPASASAMVKKLVALGLIEHEPYRGARLSGAGERVAIEVIRHHRLLELYLAQTLGLDVDAVHEEADRLEHVISEELEARIDRALGYPTHDPHGDPIPNAGPGMAGRDSGPSAKADRGKGSGEPGGSPAEHNHATSSAKADRGKGSGGTGRFPQLNTTTQPRPRKAGGRGLEERGGSPN